MSRKTKTGSALGRGVSRGDVERLLSGLCSGPEDTAELAATVRALQHLGAFPPTESEAQSFAAQAARLVPDTEGQRVPGAMHADVRRRSGSRLRPAMAGTLAALVLMVSASAGVAYAANGAAPGDALYDLDRALEKVGLGDGGLKERLNEAGLLVERGRVEAGLTHAGDAIANMAADDQGLRAAAEALWTAADAAGEGEGPQTLEGWALVAERLRQMGSTEPGSKDFGQAVDDLGGTFDAQGQTDGGFGPALPTGDGPNGDGQGPGTTATTGGNGTGTSGGSGPGR